MSTFKILPNDSCRSSLEEDEVKLSQNFLLDCPTFGRSRLKQFESHTSSHSGALAGIERNELNGKVVDSRMHELRPRKFSSITKDLSFSRHVTNSIGMRFFVLLTLTIRRYYEQKNFDENKPKSKQINWSCETEIRKHKFESVILFILIGFKFSEQTNVLQLQEPVFIPFTVIFQVFIVTNFGL